MLHRPKAACYKKPAQKHHFAPTGVLCSAPVKALPCHEAEASPSSLQEAAALHVLFIALPFFKVHGHLRLVMTLDRKYKNPFLNIFYFKTTTSFDRIKAQYV